MIKIYTSYFGKMKQIKKEVEKPLFISIARYINPSIRASVHDQASWYMPTQKLLNDYKYNNLSEEDYKKQYIEMLDEQDSFSVYEFTNKPEMFDAIFLLCYEKPEDLCHRHILREYINERYNIGIKEYGN